MKLIIGLGNPGKKFEKTRHNVGFLALDFYAKKNNYKFLKKDSYLFYKDKKFILLKPQTFMNESGRAVKKVINFYKIKIDDIIVFYDDVNFDVGVFKTKAQGSDGGQKGLRSIIDHLNTNKFWRTRIGVGNNEKFKLSDWVLSKFNKKEQEIIDKNLLITNDIIDLFIMGQKTKIMDRYN